VSEKRGTGSGELSASLGCVAVSVFDLLTLLCSKKKLLLPYATVVFFFLFFFGALS